MWGQGDVSAEPLRCSHASQCEAGELDGVTRARQARPERMHNTLSHRVKTYVPGGTILWLNLTVAWSFQCSNLLLTVNLIMVASSPVTGFALYSHICTDTASF